MNSEDKGNEQVKQQDIPDNIRDAVRVVVCGLKRAKRKYALPDCVGVATQFDRGFARVLADEGRELRRRGEPAPECDFRHTQPRQAQKLHGVLQLEVLDERTGAGGIRFG